MRIWLAGSKSFGAAVLESLGDQVVGVTCPLGQGKADALGLKATELGISSWNVIDPQLMRQSQVELIVSAHNLIKIDAETRLACEYGAVGYHPSLLPRWRGHTAVECTIAAGDAIGGGTVYVLDDGWDTGPIILQEWCHVGSDWTASDLWRDRLFPMGVRLLSQTVAKLDGQNGLPTQVQDDDYATECRNIESYTKPATSW